MLKKNNFFISRIISNLKKNPKKKFLFDSKKNITSSQLLNLSIINSYKLKNIRSKYVPIIVDRNIESVIAILSVIFAKKIFCPISKDFPNDRIINLLELLNVDHVINCSNKKINFSNEIKIKLKNNKKSYKVNYEDIHQIFYLLFTSGTTGKPKGVKLSFKNIINTLIWSKKYLNWSKHKIGIATQFSFDISMFDLFSGLYFNVPIYIFKNPSNPIETLKEIKKNKVTSIFSVPTFFSNFVKYDILKYKIDYLKRIISGGDFFSHKDIKQWQEKQKKICIFNVWGPTETSIVNTMYEITKKDTKIITSGKSIPVGKSTQLMEIKIIRNKKIINKKGEVGEICMLGDCVSQGYIGSVKNSKNYFRIKNKRAYATGDLGFFDKKNLLHIVGRKDNTIKISGFRVDTLEVEALVNIQFGFTNSCLFISNTNGINILCLAIESKKKIDTGTIIFFLRTKLPNYSIPKKIIFIKKFPLNQNNKIDRKKIKLISYEK